MDIQRELSGAIKLPGSNNRLLQKVGSRDSQRHTPTISDEQQELDQSAVFILALN